jgi:hypothetical protein
MTSYRCGKTFSLLLILFVVVFAWIPQLVFAQGESAVPFLLIAPNARADGMGEAGAALADDGSATYWNPGGLAFEKNQEVSITHSNWLPQFQLSDLYYEYFAYRNHIDDWGGTVSASIIYLNLGEFNETGEGGPTVINTFKAFETALTAGYSTKILDDFGLGINLRYIHSSLANFDVQRQGRKGVASTVSFDIGTLWKPTSLELPGIGNIEDRVSIGVDLSNLGPKLTYIDAAQADPLPTNLRLGFAFKVVKSEYNNISAIVDFSRLLVRRYRSDTTFDANGNIAHKQDGSLAITGSRVDNLPKSLFTAWGDGGLKKVIVSTGIEYWYGNPRLVALRFGYFYEHPNYGNRKFLTFGAGIRYDVYGFDFSYLSTVEENHPLAETLRFTLMIGWGGQE